MKIETLNNFMQTNDEKALASEQEYWKEVWEDYIKDASGYYNSLSIPDARVRMISEKNYRKRKNKVSCEQLGIRIRVGDICFIDFGMNYLNEAGFQHFGIIMKFCNSKAYVIPMSSNRFAYAHAYDENNPSGKRHLMRLEKQDGMNKNSVLFLNDAKWINTARIIDVKAHIDRNSALFAQIKERMMWCLK